MYSGVPNAGEPDLMSTLEVNPPYATGEPGWTSWVKAMPASASACCCTSAPATVTGAIAPARVNGVITTAWLRDEYCRMPSSIGSSNRSGELALMMVKMDGCSSRVASSTCRAMRTISRQSMLRCAPRL
jgi:hypothetical protein